MKTTQLPSQRVFPIAYNEAEAVLFRMFDARRHSLDQWRIESQGVEVGQTFHTVRCTWDGTGPAWLVMERSARIDARDYDHLTLCVQAAESTEVSIRAEVDGVERTVVDRGRGNNAGLEFEGPIGGRNISFIRIEIRDPGSAPGNVELFFLGVFHRERRDLMRGRVLPYPDDWADLLAPEGGEPSEPTQQLGLFFDKGDLTRLRERVSGPTWGPVFEQLRAIARSYLDSEPWRGIGRTVNNLPVRNGHRSDGINSDYNWIKLSAMRLCAFVGLLDKDEELMRMALYHALALAHCDNWTTGFMPNMSGSSWETRAFSEYRFAINAVFAWDWAGSLLTDAGKELLAQSVSIKALPWIQQTLMRHPYVRGNNQGIFFAFGGMVVSIALGKHWPYGDDFLEPFREAMDQTVNAYYAADGGTFEGMGYATGSLQQALAGYALYARYRGLALEDVVPEVAIKAVDYVTAMLSTEKPIGAVIKHSDGGRAGVCVRPGALGLLCRLSDDPAVPALLAGLLESPVDLGPAYTVEHELNIILGPDTLPEPGAHPPVFRNLEQTGILCSCRETELGPVRIQLIGGPAGAGHGHDDRGSFVLEGFGNELAIDRGQMPYVDPRSSTIKYARYHNLAVPHDESGKPLRQRNPCPVASRAAGTGDAVKLNCRMDLDGVWPAPVITCSREIESPAPQRFLIIDRLTADLPISLGFYVQSRFPWRKARGVWTTEGTQGRLTVIPEWSPDSEWGVEDFILGTKEPAFCLKLLSDATPNHELVTRLVVEAR